MAKKQAENAILKKDIYNDLLKILGLMITLEQESIEEKQLDFDGDYWNDGCIQRVAKLASCFKAIHCLSDPDWAEIDVGTATEMSINDMDIMLQGLMRRQPEQLKKEIAEQVAAAVEETIGMLINEGKLQKTEKWSCDDDEKWSYEEEENDEDDDDENDTARV